MATDATSGIVTALSAADTELDNENDGIQNQSRPVVTHVTNVNATVLNIAATELDTVNERIQKQTRSVANRLTDMNLTELNIDDSDRETLNTRSATTNSVTVQETTETQTNRPMNRSVATLKTDNLPQEKMIPENELNSTERQSASSSHADTLQNEPTQVSSISRSAYKLQEKEPFDYTSDELPDLVLPQTRSGLTPPNDARHSSEMEQTPKGLS